LKYSKNVVILKIQAPSILAKNGGLFAEELIEQSAIPAQERRFFAPVFNGLCEKGLCWCRIDDRPVIGVVDHILGYLALNRPAVAVLLPVSRAGVWTMTLNGKSRM